MIVETIFMALTVALLVYIAYTQHKIYVVSQVTFVGLVSFLESLEGEDEYGATQQLH